MSIRSAEPGLRAEWGAMADDLKCPHCGEGVQINGGDYLDEELPAECIWECDACAKEFAIDVIVSRKYQTATKWR